MDRRVAPRKISTNIEEGEVAISKPYGGGEAPTIYIPACQIPLLVQWPQEAKDELEAAAKEG